MTTAGAIGSVDDRRDGVSLSRLLWVGPLTVVVALVVNLLIKTVLIAINPSLADMGQLGNSLIVLTLEGAILAVIVFALMVWLVPHPIYWFGIVGVIALVISIIPDILLGMGGDTRRAGSSLVGPFLRVGAFFSPAPSGGPSPPSGQSGAVLAGLPAERVLILILLHVATAVVCIVMLTTLTREPVPGERSRV
jgi:hypothetical protein